LGGVGVDGVAGVVAVGAAVLAAVRAEVPARGVEIAVAVPVGLGADRLGVAVFVVAFGVADLEVAGVAVAIGVVAVVARAAADAIVAVAVGVGLRAVGRDAAVGVLLANLVGAARRARGHTSVRSGAVRARHAALDAVAVEAVVTFGVRRADRR